MSARYGAQNSAIQVLQYFTLQLTVNSTLLVGRSVQLKDKTQQNGTQTTDH